MSAAPIIGFVLSALLAIAFAAAPLRRMENKKTRALLLATLVLAISGIGGGAYYLLGRPHLALRAASGLETRDVSGLVPYLIKRVRQYPGDARAWRYLGQAYMSANDPANAAKALAKAIALVGKGDPALNAGYGEALVLANSGTVPPEAEAAFTAALAVDPKNMQSRFYLGLAKAARGDRPGAIQLWESLRDDMPTSSPLHQMLTDRLAMLTSQAVAQGKGPNPLAMVERLAARLKSDPNDALGWVRLMRAYTVLGETDKARAALADARKAFAGNKDAQTAFTTAAKALKLQ